MRILVKHLPKRIYTRLYSLTQPQRDMIEAMIRSPYQYHEYAKAIGVSNSTTTRERRRNEMNPKTYGHMAAHRHAESQEWKGRRIAAELLKLVDIKHRNEQCSPEQISEISAKYDIGNVSHESIYLYIYRNMKTGGDIYKHLRHRCKPNRKCGSVHERRGRSKNQVMTDELPSIIDDRSRSGDWEMDTVVGMLARKVLVNIVEWKNRFTRIRMHQSIARVLNLETNFAHPYSSCDRGLDVNTNDLICQYLSKEMSFAMLISKDIKRAGNRLNTRSRKCLDYQTPNDISKSSPRIALAG
jgi:IS30 family transposase